MNIKSNYIKKNHVKNKQNLINKKRKNNVTIFQKYIFKYANHKKNLGLTNNHQILNGNFWIKLCHLNSVNKISIIKICTKQTILKKYIHTISFLNYIKVYDLNNQQYFNFISENVIIHNSIEQDADIIIILYKTGETEYEENYKKEKVIDLRVSKNRNGGTGELKLYFEPRTTTFKDIKEI